MSLRVWAGSQLYFGVNSPPESEQEHSIQDQREAGTDSAVADEGGLGPRVGGREAEGPLVLRIWEGEAHRPGMPHCLPALPPVRRPRSPGCAVPRDLGGVGSGPSRWPAEAPAPCTWGCLRCAPHTAVTWLCPPRPRTKAALSPACQPWHRGLVPQQWLGLCSRAWNSKGAYGRHLLLVKAPREP